MEIKGGISPMWVDIVDGLIKIASSNIENNDAWELGTGTNYSVNELFNFFKENLNALQSILMSKKEITERLSGKTMKCLKN